MSEIRWYDAGIRPARPGVYPVRVPNLDRKTWARWTGQHWCCWGITPEMAALCEWPGLRGYEWHA